MDPIEFISRKGAKGALLDLYERAIREIQQLIELIPDEQLPFVIDPHTGNENCRSFQSILSHVVHAGYGYATTIHNRNEVTIIRPAKSLRLTVKEYSEDLSAMFLYTENIFTSINEEELEQHDTAFKMNTGWGQCYDIEQLTEHAIVHILRHKRQIERILRTYKF